MVKQNSSSGSNELKIWQIVDYSLWAAIYLDNLWRRKKEKKDFKGLNALDCIQRWLNYLADEYAKNNFLDVNTALAINFLLAEFLDESRCGSISELGERIKSIVFLFDDHKNDRLITEKLKKLCLAISNKFFYLEKGGSLLNLAA